MIAFDAIGQICTLSPSKIVLLVIDGLGGLPDPKTGKTELETAHTPNLDHLAKRGICGLSDPVSPGITPGSGPGHLALFGYDPFKFTMGRGVLEGLGIGFDLVDGDIAVRGNFCTVDAKGLITDRRAGRISTEKCAELCDLLRQTKLDGIELFIKPVREHRFLLVLRGNELSAEVTDTDPQKTGVIPDAAVAKKPEAERTADIANKFVGTAKGILAQQHLANMLLLRGFSKLPQIPSMSEIYKLKPAAIARYPMYKGLAKLVGMKIYDVDDGIEEELRILAACYGDHDFFYVHVKEGDSAGEDGDFQRKVKVIERVDATLPQLLNLKPDVVVVTGDHSTPAMLKGHSWHPVPVLLHAQWCRPDRVQEFSESACVSGGLGRIHATDIMPLAMA
ncbi:MAG: 2,3-bisphosphoglycerate-independent phosphoglycerate mutase, partial [Chloroflexi bacterium]|nr:2,3-bisphosphoglycerate-independent phosphoglycerate mutase [Chloroflexota bacterium]